MQMTRGKRIVAWIAAIMVFLGFVVPVVVGLIILARRAAKEERDATRSIPADTVGSPLPRRQLYYVEPAPKLTGGRWPSDSIVTVPYSKPAAKPPMVYRA